jgi:hypothetical protein
MLQNLQMTYDRDFDQVLVTFDLPKGGMEKLRDAAIASTLGVADVGHIDEAGFWATLYGGIGGFISADYEAGQVRYGRNPERSAEDQLDYWEAPDMALQWPVFVAPMRKIMEILR